MKLLRILLIISLSHISLCLIAQDNAIKTLLLKDKKIEIKYKDLDLKALLLFYDKNCEAYLLGDVSLNIYESSTDKSIAGFYKDFDQPRKKCNTIQYKNYFLTFENEKDNYYLTIEDSRLAKTFTLFDSVIIENLKIEITLALNEWGEDYATHKRFDDISQTLNLTVGDIQKEFSFYDYEIKDGFFLDIGDFRVIPLSVGWQPHYIEMIVLKGNN